MGINFQNKEGRLSYLSEKLDDLLEGINETYGRALLDELTSRLEQTITDFNEEVQTLTDKLKANTDKKVMLLEKIKSAKEENQTEAEEIKKQDNEVSEWEKRLVAFDK